jgi:uncharacterized iron-regulated membrane protein
MRRGLVLLHRWFGLFLAAFLVISGLTGAVISWDHELDAWLNPSLYHADSGSSSSARSPLALAAELESRDPSLFVTYVPLALEPGEALLMSVDPHPDLRSTASLLPPSTRSPWIPPMARCRASAGGVRRRSRARTCCRSSTSRTT